MSQDQLPQYHYDKKHLIMGIATIFLIYGVMGFFIQATNIARPRIAAELDGMALYAWSVSIPGLVSAFVTLLFGKLSDMYGRRIMLLIAVAFALLGTILSALSTTFVFLIVATCIGSLGIGAMMPLVFAVVGDMFSPIERSKWIGMLQIPMGIAAFLGPVVGGFLTDRFGWRYLFWSIVPLLVICLVLVIVSIPSLRNRGIKRKIDFGGSVWMILASSTTIIGFSFAGVTYPWASFQIMGLLGISVIFWIVFVMTEYKTDEPLLDPMVLRNRSFNTIAAVILLSSFGHVGMMMYFPMFMQGLQGVSAEVSGWIFSPFTVLMAFVGVPVGFLVARTRRYKWMYVAGFGLLTVDMFLLVLLGSQTPVSLSIMVSVLAGLGLGAIPTVNTIVVQNVVPARLLGASMGAVFFFLMMGVAISPAVLGSVMNVSYARALESSLPEGLRHLPDRAAIEVMVDSQVLLSAQKMAELEKAFDDMGDEGAHLFSETVDAIRHSMETGLRSVFLVAAVTMLLAFLLIATIPGNAVGSDPPLD
jgi:MFS family permease